MTDPLAINPEPAGRFSFKQMLPTLVFDVAMPIVAFNVLTRYGVEGARRRAIATPPPGHIGYRSRCRPSC